MAPIRIQLSRAKGWRMPPNTVKVTRPGKWGNPFNLKSGDHCWTAISLGYKGDAKGRQEASVAMYKTWLREGGSVEYKECGLFIQEPGGDRHAAAVSDTIRAPKPPSAIEIVRELSGKNLACFCKLDAPCHADVLLELANPLPPGRTGDE